MGLEINILNKYDGKTVPAFHVIDLINIRLVDNLIQVFGRVFVSEEAFKSGLAPLDNFSFIFPDLRELMKAHPSAVEADAYAWLKSLPQFAGAIDKPVGPNPIVAGESVHKP
jgi:hypothetical protein